MLVLFLVIGLAIDYRGGEEYKIGTRNLKLKIWLYLVSTRKS